MIFKIRRILIDTTHLSREIEKIKNKLDHHDQNIDLVIRVFNQLRQNKTTSNRKKIGYTK